LRPERKLNRLPVLAQLEAVEQAQMDAGPVLLTRRSNDLRLSHAALLVAPSRSSPVRPASASTIAPP